MVVPMGHAKMRHPIMCPLTVYWVGRHRWRSGYGVKVWSYDGHADDLVEARRPPNDIALRLWASGYAYGM